jgi:hypothetical protein
VPILPVLYLLVQEGIHAALSGGRLRSASQRRFAAACALLLVAAVPLHLRVAFEKASMEARGADRFTRNMTLVGVTLARRLPATARIALNPAGAVPYYSGLYAYDMLGLTNLHIARKARTRLGEGVAGHEKGDGAYILDERPDLILFGNVMISPTVPADLAEVRWQVTFASEKEIARDPRTRRLYVPDQLPLGAGLHLLFLRRRDFVVPPDQVDRKRSSPNFWEAARS